MNDDQVIYADPRLTQILDKAAESARLGYEALVRGEAETAKKYLAHLIGVQDTLASMYRPVEPPVFEHHPIEDDRVEKWTKRQLSKLLIK